MTEPWDNLEAEMREMPLEGLSTDVQERILGELARQGETRAQRVPRVLAWAAIAAVVCLAAGIWIWVISGPQHGAAGPDGSLVTTGHPATLPITFLPGWRVEPTGLADFDVAPNAIVRLRRGELLIESVRPARGGAIPALTVQTPLASASAKGTRFYIAAHMPTSNTLQGEQAMKPIVRVLVLSGAVLLSNQFGSVTGEANQLLAAEEGKAPVNHALVANNAFAFDLYAQLAEKDQGQNLFFSPYSISTVLTMVAEGARGETADQMGKALHFPQAAKRIGNDAQLIPWNVGLIHTGMQSLSERLSSADTPAKKAIRAKIAALRKELDAANALSVSAKDGNTAFESQRKAQGLADKINALLPQVDQYELRLANSLWAERTYPINPPYVETINKFYGTKGAFPVDFINKPDQARKDINDWVAQQTNNRIQDIIPPKALDSLTRMVLANAIYFRGQWEKEFDPQNTADGDFRLQGGAKQTVPLMNLSPSAGYAAFKGDGTFFETPMKIRRSEAANTSKFYPGPKGFQLLELPYKGGELSMVVLLPQSPDGLPALQKMLTSKNVDGWIAKLHTRPVGIALPKFKLETGYELGAPLEAMGMVRAFQVPTARGGAQLDGLSQSQDPEHKLYISRVLHRALVEVNEKGTEAVAATIVIGSAAAEPPEEEVAFWPTFRADRPFVFLIRDCKTGVIIFVGRLVNPKG